MQLNAVPSDWWYGKDRRKLEKSRFGDLWFGTGQCGGLFRIRVCFAILPLDASHTRQIALASLHNTVSSLASASWLEMVAYLERVVLCVWSNRPSWKMIGARLVLV